MNNPFEYLPDGDCLEAYRGLTERIESLRDSVRPEDIAFIHELDNGKMLGVMMASDSSGVRHSLFAFSGQIGNMGFHFPGFVEPVFDYLAPDGYFKTKEREISSFNAEITRFEIGPLAELRKKYRHAQGLADAEIEEFRERCRRSKEERDAVRKDGSASGEELSAMIRQSQFEKAELRRLKKRLESELEPLREGLRMAEAHLATMKEKRRSDSEALQHWLFSNFRLLNARGESISLSEIFAGSSFRVPPSGAGECCAPKLLQAAYLRGWRPLSIAEFWYGKPKDGEVRVHGMHYPACRGKCLPVLGWMLQGLDINPPLGGDSAPDALFSPEMVYENQWFCIIDKPAGMLSVPGKGRSVSLEEWLAERYGTDRKVRMAHRLDRDTSGLMVATFGEDSYRLMQSLFATRQVQKTYVADLDGDYEARDIPQNGRIDLPLSPDWLDRPRQRVAFEGGKEAVTEYEFEYVEQERSRVIFRPLTGRTHQLRVHAASSLGLGMPIAGDPLYGKNTGVTADRLHLHARKLEFIFPTDGKRYVFESPVPF